MRLFLCLVAFLVLSGPCWADNLTQGQLTTLGTAIRANPDPTIQQAVADNAYGVIAVWYNQPSTPAYWCWKSSTTAGEVGRAINLKELGNIVSANAERLQTAFVLVGTDDGSFHPVRGDHRAFFADMFSGAAGSQTRVNLLALWQRQATRAEKIFASGAGTQATGEIDDGTGEPDGGSPGTFTWEDSISAEDVDLALEATQ